MQEVPLQVQRLAQSNIKKLYSETELDALKQYYGTHPELLSGFFYLR
jgi:hypothetical protein